MAYAGALRAVAPVAAHSRTRAGILVRIARNTAGTDVGATSGTRLIGTPSSAAGAVIVVPGSVVGPGILHRSRGIVDIIVYRCGPPVEPVRGEIRIAEIDVLRKRNDRDIDVAGRGDGAVQL